MTQLIVVFPKAQDADSIRKILIRSGFAVAIVCTSGTAALQAADRLDGGILVCGYRLKDMLYSQLYEELPRGFSMLLLASEKYIQEGIPDGVRALAMPIKSHSLVETLDNMVSELSRRSRRSGKPKRHTLEQTKVIERAKECLMQRNQMTEDEAHKYLQKTSMENGTNIVDTARMILSLMA